MGSEEYLPSSVCQPCVRDATRASKFHELCLNSSHRWTQGVEALENIPCQTPANKVYVIFSNLEEAPVYLSQVNNDALKVLNKLKRDPKRKPRRQSKGSKLSKCPYCNKIFKMPYYLNLHLKNTLQRACRKCGQVLPREILKQHLSEKHDKHLYNCKVCHNLFKDSQTLAHHLNSVHTLLHSCEVCKLAFPTDRSLRAHMYSHTLFHCKGCTKSFENRRCFKHHQTICQEDLKENNFTEYICDTCGNKYTKKPSLRIHIIQKHLNVLPYTCDICGHRTSTVGHLRMHELTHSTERVKYKCDACGAIMTSRLGLVLHHRIHSGEKPFPCRFCSEAFLSSSRRLDHMKRRHGTMKDMAHKCSMCSARFVRPFELRKHFQKAHLDKKTEIKEDIEIKEEQ